TPWDAPLHFISRSTELAEALTSKLIPCEDRGWIEVDGATYTRALVNQLRQRCAVTTFRTPQNERERQTLAAALKHAVHSFERNPPRTVPPKVDKPFDLTGAKVSSLTQSLAYKGIRQSHVNTERRTTRRNVAEIQAFLKLRNVSVPEAMLWKELRHGDIRHAVTDFLWKGVHGAHRIGQYWTHIPGLESRAECRLCGVPESLEHILTTCIAKERSLIWTYVERAWKRAGGTWYSQSLPSILAVGFATPQRTNGKAPREHTVRLWRMLITEAAHLLWRLRCERVIQHDDEEDWQHNERGIAARWYQSINMRLRLDIESTHPRFGRLALKRQLVLDTWHHLVWDVQALPDDWTSVRWVLVGIDPDICSIDRGPGD
ncbi:uncharacterized protein B0H18DRAFT_876724, partial [Fomitopsis serialis]|uniref:uncharacterized protein n=1 Tax=Fomitopsis serialis TaxID=139415 RepID=UPI0020072679